MGSWVFLSNLINYSFAQGLLINSSYEVIKQILGMTRKDSFQNQFYSVINHTFSMYFRYYNWEYCPETVLPSFFEAVEAQDGDAKGYVKYALEVASGLEITTEQLEKWIQLFKEIVSNPMYQWVYNRLQLADYMAIEDKRWMRNWVSDNACIINNQFDLTNDRSIIFSAYFKLNKLFNGVETILSEECWEDTRNLIYELLVNSYIHGNAKNSFIEIGSSSISFIDDGKKFDPHKLSDVKCEELRGGKDSIKKFITKYPEVERIYLHHDGLNKYTVKFNADMFDVNGMSNITADSVDDLLELNVKKDTIGAFKYYYLDFEKVNVNRENSNIWLPISVERQLIKEFVGDIPIYKNKSKVYIVFPSLLTKSTQTIYNTLECIAEEFNRDKENLEIIIMKKNIN